VDGSQWARLRCGLPFGLLMCGLSHRDGCSACAVASLSDELAAQYKLVKMAADSSGLVVTEPGTVLTGEKGRRALFPARTTMPAVLATKYENGSIHSPARWRLGCYKPYNVPTRFLTAGERV